MPKIPIHAILNSVEEPADYESQILSPWILAYIFTFMYWPQDITRRTEYMCLSHFDLLTLLDKVPFLDKDKSISVVLEEGRARFGGWQALASLPPKNDFICDIENRSARAEWVGVTLFIAYTLKTHHTHQLKEKVSLRKVREFLFRNRNLFFPIPPKKEALKDAWDEYKAVSHLWAAKHYIEQLKLSALPQNFDNNLLGKDTLANEAWKKASFIDPTWNKRMLSYAMEFQEFGLRYKPANSRTSLLDPDLLWTLEDLPNWGRERPAYALPDELVEDYND